MSPAPILTWPFIGFASGSTRTNLDERSADGHHTEIGVHRFQPLRRKHQEAAPAIGGIGPAGNETLVFELTNPAKRSRGRNRRTMAGIADRNPLLAKLGLIEFEKNIPGGVGEDVPIEEAIAIASHPDYRPYFPFADRLVGRPRNRRAINLLDDAKHSAKAFP